MHSRLPRLMLKTEVPKIYEDCDRSARRACAGTWRRATQAFERMNVCCVAGERDNPEPPDCEELRSAYERAERAHLRAWLQFGDASAAETEEGRSSPTERARLKQLADESAATARIWTEAFHAWWRACGELQ